MPKTIENYSQEVGRAGRDGLPSTCLLFLCPSDIPILEGFARGDTCAKKDMELWLQEVALKQQDSDGTISFNHYTQTKMYVLSIVNHPVIFDTNLLRYDIRVCEYDSGLTGCSFLDIHWNSSKTCSTSSMLNWSSTTTTFELLHRSIQSTTLQVGGPMA